MSEWRGKAPAWRHMGDVVLAALDCGTWAVRIATVDGVVRQVGGGSSGRADGETEAERLANAKAAAESWVRDFALSLLREVGERPAPGDVLTPDDFGEGEGGVLRLAALLSEAPDGAAVSYMPECRDFPAVVLRKSGGLWDDSDGRLVFMWIARRAPLTVVAWPS